MREQVIEAVLKEKIIAIIRGVDEDKAIHIAQALYAGGIRLVEVTFNQKEPASFIHTAGAIRRIRETIGEDIHVGAGTVTTVELAEMAAQAGAEYVVSPDTDEAVISRTRELGMVSIPGAYTASEAKRAHCAGADFVKLFPCVECAQAYLKALCAPLNHIRFLAVGGITADNCADFLKAGALGVGVGGSLTKKDWIAAGDYGKISAEARRFIVNISRV